MCNFIFLIKNQIKVKNEKPSLNDISPLIISESKKYQRNSSTLKHALVNNNKESIIESRIMRLS